MTCFATLLLRELHARRMLLLASVSMGALVFALPWFTNRTGATPAEIRGAAAMTVALLWSALLAVGLGATCLARDLGENRLAFDFRLPVSGSAIWAARVLGSFLIVLACGAAVIAVAALGSIDLTGTAAGVALVAPWADIESPASWLSALSLAAPLFLGALMLAKNVGGLLLFGDRRWSALDLAAIAILAILAFAALTRLIVWGMSPWQPEVLLSGAAVLVVGLTIASWSQVVSGRTEASRAHARASVALFITSLSAGGILLLSSGRAVTPDWNDLDSSAITDLAPLTDEVLYASARLGRVSPAAFRLLHDPETGVTLRLGPAVGRFRFDPPRLSGDGSIVVWSEQPGTWRGGSEVRLVRLSLPNLRAEPEVTRIVWEDSVHDWDLAPEGDRVVSNRGAGEGEIATLVLEELNSGRIVESLRIANCPQPGAVWFRDAEHLHLECGPMSLGLFDPSRIRYDVEIATGKAVRDLSWSPSHRSRPVQGFTAEVPSLVFEVDPEAPRTWRVVRSGDPDPVARLPAPEDLETSTADAQAVLLRDGRSIVLAGRGPTCRLLVYDRQGEPLRELRFPDAERRKLVGPLSRGRFVVVAHSSSGASDDFGPGWMLDRISLSNGSLTRLDDGARWLRGSPRSLRSLVLQSSDSRWSRLDPESASLVPVFGPASTGGGG